MRYIGLVKVVAKDGGKYVAAARATEAERRPGNKGGWISSHKTIEAPPAKTVKAALGGLLDRLINVGFDLNAAQVAIESANLVVAA